MSANHETILISPCPVCNSSHTYELQIERSIVLGLMTDSGREAQPNKVRFSMLFLCPEKDQDFQATIVLTETAYSRIKSVTVLGVADEDQ